MGARLEFRGLDEFRRALHGLPDHLAREGEVVVVANAEEAERRIEQVYPQRTGRLRRGLSLKVEGSRRGGIVATVRSRAAHAHLWERGTNERRTGKGAARGRMLAGPASQRMVPIVVRRRRAMIEALKDLVRRAGFRVE